MERQGRRTSWSPATMVLLAMTVMVLLAVAGYAHTEESARTENGVDGELMYTELSQMEGKTIGIMTGSVFDGMLKEILPTAKAEYYNTHQDMAEATVKGKIDGFMADEPIYGPLCRGCRSLVISANIWPRMPMRLCYIRTMSSWKRR